jgi:hypothetical protein
MSINGWPLKIHSLARRWFARKHKRYLDRAFLGLELLQAPDLVRLKAPRNACAHDRPPARDPSRGCPIDDLCAARSGRHWRGPQAKLARRRSEHVDYSGIVLVTGACMALSLHDVRYDPVANRALSELMHHYTVAEEKSRLVLTKKSGDMKLFLYDLDDLHQLDFFHNQQMVKEIERLHVLSSTIDQQRDSWKVRALMAEAELLEATAKTSNIDQQRAGWKVRALMAEQQLLEATAKTSNNGGRHTVSDLRYASLKRYLAKRFHPDYAPGEGIEKIVRNEIFKEIWNEIDRLDQGVSAARFATARSSSGT